MDVRTHGIRDLCVCVCVCVWCEGVVMVVGAHRHIKKGVDRKHAHTWGGAGRRVATAEQVAATAAELEGAGQAARPARARASRTAAK